MKNKTLKVEIREIYFDDGRADVKFFRGDGVEITKKIPIKFIEFYKKRLEENGQFLKIWEKNNEN